jgi:hypothetical protein
LESGSATAIAGICDVCHIPAAGRRAMLMPQKDAVMIERGRRRVGQVGRICVPARLNALIAWPILVGTLAMLCGCAASSLSELKDAEWFNRPSRAFGRSLSLETPPLTEQRAVSPDDLISAEGYCSGMAPTAAASALAQAAPGSEAAAPAASGPAGVALGRTECEVARYVGRPDNVELSSNPGGERTAALTYLRGSRPGIYRFVAGRLTEVDRAPTPAAPERPVKKKKTG